MRVFLRNPVLAVTQDQRYQDYLHDRLTGNNIIQIGSIVVEDPPLVKTAIVRRTYIKNPHDHWTAWVAHGLASLVISIVPPTLIKAIPAFDFSVPDPTEIFQEPVTSTITIEVPTIRQEERTINVPREISLQTEVQTRNNAGEIQADPVAIDQVADLIESIVRDGGTIVSTEFDARSSDEWGPLTSSLGKPNEGNIKTASDRAATVTEALSSSTSLRGNNLGEVRINSSEDLWSEDEIMYLDALSTQLGFSSPQSLYDTYKTDKDSLPQGVKDWFDIKFDQKRGTNITIKYIDEELVEQTILVPVPGTTPTEIDITIPPVHDPFDLRIFPIFIPPLGRREEEREKLFPQSHEEDLVDQAIIKLFPEAKTLSGTLREHPWADTRKYDFLLKNDRFGYVHRFEYLDKQGKEQTIHLAFVDHVPSLDALMAAVKVAQEAAQEKTGKVGKKLDLVAFFPEGQTRTQEPLDLGLGIDEKLGQGVLGLAIPALGLVEVQYDPHATYDELTSSGGMVHTLRHEILGHFTDLTDASPQLHRVSNIPNGYTLSTPWKGILEDLYYHHLQMELLGAPIQFDIVRSVDGQQPGQMFSNDGELFEHSTVHEVPDDGSVVSVNLRRFTDDYAKTDPLEYWAQSVAYALAETSVDPSTTFGTWLLPPDVTSRLGGYRPDKKVIEIVHKTLGTMQSRDGAAFPLEFQPRPDFVHTGGLEGDAEFQGIIDRAKSRVLPKDKDLINVVTTVRPLDRGVPAPSQELSAPSAEISANPVQAPGLSL